jgi:hypothetical protein
MANRVSAKSTDTAGMIHMAKTIAAHDDTTQYLVPGYYGLHLDTRAPRGVQYLRVEPNGEVWKHSRWEHGGPNGPEAPKRLA